MIVVILCTAPDVVCAEQLARSALDSRLAACVSYLPQMVSIYRWQGEIKQQNEIQLLLKTDTQRQAALLRHLKAQHPYQVPELLAIPASAADNEYASWLTNSFTD